MGGSHEKPLSAFMAAVMVLWFFPETHLLVLELSQIFSQTRQPPQKRSIWSISGRSSAPRMLRGKLIPGGHARGGAEEGLAVHHGKQPVRIIHAVRRAGGVARRAG